MIQTKKGWQDQSDSYTGGVDDTGFRYGMFEIRCKLPAKNSFPAYWLYSGGTEIDIFETGQQDHITNNIHDWPPPHTHCQNFYEKISWDDVTTVYHTYNCVWTPDRVTFFYDGREIRTIDASQISTYPFNATMIINLAMQDWHWENTHMDIDYIRVYKPANEDYNLPYKSDQEYMHHQLSQQYGIGGRLGSIAANTDNTDEVFCRDESGAINAYSLSTGIVTQISQNTSTAPPGSHCLGELMYNPVHQQYMYKGTNKRINAYYWNGIQWNHYYLDDWWTNSTNQGLPVSNTMGSVDISSSGNIAYKSDNNKIHLLNYNSLTLDWEHFTIPHTYGGNCVGWSPADCVGGDVVFEKGTDNIIYKGLDKRMQLFYKNQSGNYVHSWIDNYWNTSQYLVGDREGSILSTINDGIFYIGQDNKLHNFRWNGSAMTHTLIPHNYNNPNLGFPGADFMKGNITWDENTKTLYYLGFDGRIQYFTNPLNTNMDHGWVNDYWSTTEYNSYDINVNPNLVRHPSLSMGANGEVFYGTHHQRLSYFVYEPCENLNPPCGGTGLLNKTEPIAITKPKMELTTSTKVLQNSITASPNPFTNKVTLNGIELPKKVAIYNMQGVKVVEKELKTSELELAELPLGYYLAVFEHKGKKERVKLIKK